MELRIILSNEEQKLLDTEQDVYDESAVLPLLFDANTVFQRVAGRMETLRGHTAGQREALNTAWHEHTILSDLIYGLSRVAGLDAETTAR